MLYGIISDVHGNLEASLAVKEFLQKSRVEKVIFLGDIVGYGVNPQECLDLFNSSDAICIKGNHEQALITGQYEGFSLDAKISIEWARKNVSEKHMEELSKWRETLEIDDFVICHGGLNNPLYFYTNSRAKAKKMFDEFEFKYCFVGHTHFPMAFVLDSEQDFPSIIAEQPDGSLHILLEETKRYIINVGSVGQPRDGNPEACCGLYDKESMVFHLWRIPYPAETTARKIIEAGLPSSLSARILRGL